MSLTFKNPASTPANTNREGIPTPRTSTETHAADHTAEALASGEHVHEAIHRALGLTADQAVQHYHAYNTTHETRDQRPIDGGEMVVRATIVGQGVDGELAGSIEVDDENRGGLDELTIKTLGLQAMGVPKVKRIVL
jgi:hypothetical protein